MTAATDGGDLRPPHDRPATIPELVAAAVERDPGGPAILAPERAPLTYLGLRDRIGATAGALNALGLGCGDRVALVLPDGPDLAVAFLAAATAATAAPLNPALSAAEFDHALGDLPARALVVPAGVESPARAAAAARGVPVVELAVAPGAAAGCFALAGPAARTARSGPPRPDDIALVLQTSGTTGRPKRVPLTHRNLSAGALARRDALGLGPGDRSLNLTPMVYIANLGIFLASLAAGASVVCPPGFDAPRFFAWFARWRPTWYMAAPAMHRAILERAPAHPEAIAASRLRFVRTGGAPLPAATAAELERLFGVPVLEGYGLTETAALATITPLPPRPPTPGSVGVAVGVELAVVDDAGRPLPPHATGEVVVRGPNVMRGYEGEPAANADVFFPGGWFRTGDLGHLDADGYLFLVGRRKEQINRGGEKVAPAEVEEALLAHPAVAQAAAFALPDERLGEEVAAAVVLRPGRTATERALREAAARRLAPFKVPRRIVVVDALPTGPGGKVRHAELAQTLGLADPSPAPTPAAAPIAPRTDAEHLVAGLWAEVLGLGPGRVGVGDGFAALGGDSLAAGRVVARLRRALGIELSLATFFDAPTVADMARIVEDMLLDEAASAPGAAVAAAG